MRALSGVLVVAQVAVALMLLTGAGLLIQSFAQALESGYRTRGGERRHRAHRVDAREHRASDEAANKIRERLFQAMREIPGVTSVALSAPRRSREDCRSTRSPWRTTRCRRVRRSRARSG